MNAVLSAGRQFRLYSRHSRDMTTKALAYCEHGDLMNKRITACVFVTASSLTLCTVQLTDVSMAEMTRDTVHVRFLAAPINPSDINQIEGSYPLRPSVFPAVAGNEGVAEVLAVGTGVTDMHVGDWVVPARPLLGS